MVLRKLGTCKKVKLDHLLIPHTRIHSKWVKDLNVRLKTIEVLEENINSEILDITLSNIYFQYIFSGKENKRKIDKWCYMKLARFCTAKGTITK